MPIRYSNISVYLPVLLPHLFERKELMPRFQDALEEFYGVVRNTRIIFENGHESYLYVNCFHSIDDLPQFKQMWKDNASPSWDCHFLNVNAHIEFSDSDVEQCVGDLVDQSPTDKINLYLSLAGKLIEKELYGILVALNIAKAGLVTSSRGAIFIENVFRGHVRGLYNMFFEASRIAQELGWPKIRNLQVIRVWTWLKSFDFPRSSTSEGPIGRVIAAITHLMKDTFIEAVDTMTLDIIWILLGLEALYGIGNGDMQNQLPEKAIAFLGEPLDHTNKFALVYDLRSRLIHGEIDIPFSYCSHDTRRGLEKFSKGMDQPRLIALSVLLASVQKLIAEDRRQLHFKYHVAES